VDVEERRLDQICRGGKSLEVGEDLKKTIRETIKKDLEINELEKDMVFDRTLWGMITQTKHITSKLLKSCVAILPLIY